MKTTNSDYTYKIIDGIIFIEDLDRGRTSVTNDIENVLDAIALEMTRRLGTEFHVSQFKIVYRDSSGMIDGISTKNDKFDWFYPIQVATFEEAKEFLSHP